MKMKIACNNEINAAKIIVKYQHHENKPSAWRKREAKA
jgi:hypothetical protein